MAIAVFAGAAASDLARRRIPNALVIALAALGLVRIGLAMIGGAGAAPVGADLGASLLVMASGAAMFHFGLLGGGDVKLLAAAALWIGAPELGPFLMVTVLAGGALALCFLTWAALLRGAERERRISLPYGVAIAAAGVLATLTAL